MYYFLLRKWFLLFIFLIKKGILNDNKVSKCVWNYYWVDIF